MKKGDILLYGEIGQSGITAEFIQKEIAKLSDVDEIRLLVNSPGGDVFEGYSIFNALKSSGKKITAEIQGMCASIATVIVGAAEEVVMSPLAQYVIHNPTSGYKGDAKGFKGAADQLEKIESTMIGIYADRSNLPKETIASMMDDETSFSAAEALKAGFVDKVQEPLKAVAKYDSMIPEEKTALQSFVDEAKSFLAKLKNPSKALLDATPEGVELEVEGDEVKEGAMVWIVSDGERVEKAPEGDHKLVQLDIVITVDGEGKISAIKEGSEPEAESDGEEEESAEAKRIAELEAKITKFEEMQKAQAAVKEKKEAQAYETQIAELERKYEALLSGPIGGGDDEPAKNTKGVTSRDTPQANASGLDRVAAKLRNELYHKN